MSMNLLTHRCPTHEHMSDACEHGIGGWSSSGRAWRFALPEEPWGRFTLNYLELLAAVIGPWIDHIEGNLPTLSCVLSGTDSTTAEGWLRKSNFVSHGEKDADVAVKLATARRKLADMLIERPTPCCAHSGSRGSAIRRPILFLVMPISLMLTSRNCFCHLPNVSFPQISGLHHCPTRSLPGLSRRRGRCPSGSSYNGHCREARSRVEPLD